jgi:hypothetical protein
MHYLLGKYTTQRFFIQNTTLYGGSLNKDYCHYLTGLFAS